MPLFWLEKDRIKWGDNLRERNGRKTEQSYHVQKIRAWLLELEPPLASELGSHARLLSCRIKPINPLALVAAASHQAEQ